jgi:hypothetical protein
MSVEPSTAQSSDFTGKRLLLIDDVMTTGASLDELARTVKLHGAVHVALLVRRPHPACVIARHSGTELLCRQWHAPLYAQQPGLAQRCSNLGDVCARTACIGCGKGNDAAAVQDQAPRASENSSCSPLMVTKVPLVLTSLSTKCSPRRSINAWLREARRSRIDDLATRHHGP